MAKHTNSKKPKGHSAARNNPKRSSSQTARQSRRSHAPKVRVRMYRQGLGDCFLLTFDVGGDERHILIDCGTLGAKTSGIQMRDVIDHIYQTTNGQLHRVIATHEHKDHVSGFAGKTRFKDLGFKVDAVWMAWTENPEDALARKLAKNRKDIGRALALSLQAAGAQNPAAAVISGMLGFFEEPAQLGAAELSKTIDEAMHFVRKEMASKTEYHEPGDLIDEDRGVPGFRFYVLGPPRDEDKLNELGDHGSEELYGMSRVLHSCAARRLGLRADGELGPLEDGDAFDIRFIVKDPDKAQGWYPEYHEPSEQWRAIEDEWLGPANDLALQMDSMTNNTSLALAIERIADGKVLLFPADAQQGHWLSWHDPGMAWRVRHNGNTRQVTAQDLLKRTVFYKVGHHASHNATASRQGLEMMESSELTAFIPVDRAVALSRNPKGSWRMPARQLYKRLLEKCGGRVVRSDLGWAGDAKKAASMQVESELKDLATAGKWTEWRKAQEAAEGGGLIVFGKESVKSDGVYIDYFLL